MSMTMCQPSSVVPRTKEQRLTEIDIDFCELKMVTMVPVHRKVRHEPQGRENNDRHMCFWERWKSNVRKI